jgi:similar to stage IV sporulation protein
MILLNIIKYILGYVRLSVSGGFSERFLNLAARDGVGLWGISRKFGVLYVYTLAKGFKKLHSASRKSGVKLHIISKKGIPFKLRRYRKRKGIGLGIVLFLVLLFVLSSFIWTIDVSGNKTLSKSDIIDTLDELGLHIGTLKMGLDYKKIENQAIMKLPQLSWLAINVEGSRVDIEVKERTMPPEIVPKDHPCNIKAIRAGQIVNIEVYDGAATIKKGDTVVEGQMIVNGIVEDKNGASKLVHATAKVIARTLRKKEVTIPFKNEINTLTGKKINKNEIILLGIHINLYFNSGNLYPKYDKIVKENNMHIGGISLPLTIITNEYHEKVVKKVTYSEEQAKDEATKELAKYEETDLSGIKIIDRQVKTDVTAVGVKMTAEYICEEEIGIEEELKVN